MLKADIQVGQTYLFTGSTNVKRANLAGQPFTVVDVKEVWRKMTYMGRKKSGKTIRFFNADGVGAKAEELEPYNAGAWVVITELPADPGTYTVQSLRNALVQTEWDGNDWQYDLDQEDGDFVVKWLREDMKHCAQCHGYLPIANFKTAGENVCMRCDAPDLDF